MISESALYLTYIILSTFPIMSIVKIGGGAMNLSLADIAILLLGIVWLFNIKNFKVRINYPFLWYIIPFVLIMAVSAIYNMHSTVNTAGVAGLISETIKLVIVAVYLFVGYNAVNMEMKNGKKLILSWVTGLYIFMTYGLYAYVSVSLGREPWTFNNTLGNHSRFLGTITDANAAALYLSISFFVILIGIKYIFDGKKWKLFLSATNVLTLVCICFTLSRGGITGFIAGLSIYILFNIRKYIRHFYVFTCVVCLIMLFLFIDTAFFENNFLNGLAPRIEDIFKEGGMLNTRITLALSALDMGLDNPIIGVGRGNFPLNSEPYLLARGADLVTQRGLYINMVAHNTIAGIFAELGVIGLIIFLSVYVVMAVKIIKAESSDTYFKIIVLSCWLSIFIQSLSISLENSRVLWILLGLTVSVCDKNARLVSIRGRESVRNFKHAVIISFITLFLSIVMYLFVALRYSYGHYNIDGTFDIERKISKNSEYTLRYYIRSYTESNVLLQKNNEIIQSEKYTKAAGYANIYFDAGSGDNILIRFIGKEDTRINDVKLIDSNNVISVLEGKYPLLPNWLYRSFRKYLVDKESRIKTNREYIMTGYRDKENQINFGDKINFKGVNILKDEDGSVQFEFTFECLDEMEYNYIMWTHVNVNDINTIQFDHRPRNYINLDHMLEIPTNNWEKGKEYKHILVPKLPMGLYSLRFGFYVPSSGEESEPRLYIDKTESGITLGWFAVGMENE